MRTGKSELSHPIRDFSTLRWAGEYSDYIQRPHKVKQGRNFQRKRKKSVNIQENTTNTSSVDYEQHKETVTVTFPFGGVARYRLR